MVNWLRKLAIVMANNKKKVIMYDLAKFFFKIINNKYSIAKIHQLHKNVSCFAFATKALTLLDYIY